MLLFFQKIICIIVSFFMMVGGMFAGTNFKDKRKDYIKNVESVSAYSNTLETATPQTEIYNIINEHLTSPLAEGKTEKKVLVIGYDGCRADALTMLDNEANGGISYLLSTGGSAEIAYCGGVNYPAINTQDTSTAPGWCSILTGQWADVHGITGNGIEKSNDTLTLLTTAVEEKDIDSSAFYVSWNGHFGGEDTTYINEKNYIEEKALNVKFLDADDDAGTKVNTLADINSANCSDFIFAILEHPDHAGHDTGFSINNPDYQQAFADSEADSLEIIKAVEARATYATEDWLIVITSDHGGYNTGHGMLTIQERMTFIITR
ncbi:MAG: alkaline phosphatase family protein [Clostridia bacterium]|nr:alkaline phosphatase family protein [Clostridia bacterium]